ncbi:hypothetical protein [Ammoniphilus resinae]|uniref:Membrane protein (GlpM family) n=1 Tax=Ammoniphilus resinae TaxID=861532 RepID=A0ABS4GVE1_9BACL|nr:hypothetical protein [Ammoniphilus resinae]MBP1933850.1 putative membrane protein (GlpM family) [Ammoniphilus resinae]
MSRTTTNIIYIAFLVVVTFAIPILLLVGTGGSIEGMIGAVLSFIAMASYVAYTMLLGARNS